MTTLLRPSFTGAAAPARILGSLKAGSPLRTIWPDGVVALKRTTALREFDLEAGEFSPGLVYVVDLTGELDARLVSLAILASRWWRTDSAQCLYLLRAEREIAVGTEHFAGVSAPVAEEKPKQEDGNHAD